MGDSARQQMIGKDIVNINAGIIQALRIKHKIVERIEICCGRLLQDPTDQVAQRFLKDSLARERDFVEIVRKRADTSLVSLRRERHAAKRLGRSVPPGFQKGLVQMIDNLIHSLKFTRSRIAYVSKRISEGEGLESGGYGAAKIRSFQRKLDKEREIDRQLIERQKTGIRTMVPSFRGLGEMIMGVNGLEEVADIVASVKATALVSGAASASIIGFAGEISQAPGMSESQRQQNGSIVFILYAISVSIGLCASMLYLLPRFKDTKDAQRQTFKIFITPAPFL